MWVGGGQQGGGFVLLVAKYTAASNTLYRVVMGSWGSEFQDWALPEPVQREGIALHPYMHITDTVATQ